MKLAVYFSAIFCILISAVAGQGIPEKMKQNFQACLTQFNTNEENFKSGKVDNCFYLCWKQKMGVMDANGGFTIDSFKASNSGAPPQLIENLQACAATSKKANPCNSAKALSDCMKSKMP